jgi:hypothetical protein
MKHKIDPNATPNNAQKKVLRHLLKGHKIYWEVLDRTGRKAFYWEPAPGSPLVPVRMNSLGLMLRNGWLAYDGCCVIPTNLGKSFVAHPGFEAQHGRKPVAGEDYDPLYLTQDEHDYLAGVGAYF